jgi:hypothetical protein
MKVVANSLRKNDYVVQFAADVYSRLIQPGVSDVASVMFRTKVNSIKMSLRGVRAVQNEVFEPPYVLIMGKLAFNGITGESVGDPDAYLNACVMAETGDVSRIVTSVTDVATYSVGGVYTGYDAVIPFTELGATMCGTDYYLVVLPGAFEGTARVQVITERVQITDAELQSLLSCPV